MDEQLFTKQSLQVCYFFLICPYSYVVAENKWLVAMASLSLRRGKRKVKLRKTSGIKNILTILIWQT